jgi:hypothetical protein
MSENSSQENRPDFSSLSGIMQHFNRVPLEQFKSELNEWFYKSLDEKQIDLCKLNGENTTCFPAELKAFVEEIFKQAEILQKQQDNK